MHQRHRRDVAVQRRGSPTQKAIRDLDADTQLLRQVSRKIDSRGLINIPLPLPSIPILSSILDLADPLISFKPRVKAADPVPSSSLSATPSSPTGSGDGSSSPGNGTGNSPGTGSGTNPSSGSGTTPATGSGDGNGNTPSTGSGGTSPSNGSGTGTTPSNITDTGGTGTGGGTQPATGPGNGQGTGAEGTGTESGNGGTVNVGANPSDTTQQTDTNNNVVSNGEQSVSVSEPGASSVPVAQVNAGSSTLTLSPTGFINFGGSSSMTVASIPTDNSIDNASASSNNGGSGVAIGVGVALGLLALIGGILLFCCCRRRRRQREKAELVAPHLQKGKVMDEKNHQSPLGSLLNIARGTSSGNLTRISAASSFASPIATLPHTQLFDEDPFSDNSSHEHHATVESSSSENPFQDQNPFVQSFKFDPAFDAPTAAFPTSASPPPAAVLASGPTSSVYANLVRARTPSPAPGQTWVENRVSVASSTSVNTITPVSFSQAIMQQQNQTNNKHTSVLTTSSGSHHPMGVFPIPIGDNGGTYTIRRPFRPTLSDELAVTAGDVVILVRAFDDGWAFVSKTQTETVAGNAQTRGLIPIECFSFVDLRASSSSTLSRSSSLNQ